MPFLSIIVPVYNVEKYLEECLDSILAQTFKDYELILVDDGSTDQSSAICQRYSNKNDAVKVICKKNGGQTSARKVGVEVSCGKYIGFVDADDKIEKTMYDKLCNEAIKNNADVVICDVLQWEGDKIYPIKQGLNGGVFSKKTLEEEIYPYMLFDGKYYEFGFLPAVWNKIYRSDILKKNQFAVNNSIRIGEDAACSYLCILDSSKVSYLKNDYEYYYRINRESTCQNWTNKNISSASILLDYLYKRLIENGNPNVMEQYWYYYNYMLTNMIFEYEEYRIKYRLKTNVVSEFKEFFQMELTKRYSQRKQNLKIPFYRIIAEQYARNAKYIDFLLMRLFIYGKMLRGYLKRRK